MNRFLVVCVLLIMTSIPLVSQAQTSEEVGQEVIEPNLAPFPGESQGDRALMTHVILNRLTIWVRPRDGSRVYIPGCRSLRFGCEVQVAEFVKYIWDESERQNFNPWLVAGIAWHESRFNPFAQSSQHAYGILQILQRSAWSEGLPFVRQRWFRENTCRRELGSCQQPVVERSIYWLRRSIAQCGSIQRGLRMYNSGQCTGTLRYARIVYRYRDLIVAEAESIRQNGYIDPVHPNEGPVYFADDDCAEPTLEEYLCERGQAPCDTEGVRSNCVGE